MARFVMKSKRHRIFNLIFVLTQCVISVSLIAKGGMDYAYKKSKSKCYS